MADIDPIETVHGPLGYSVVGVALAFVTWAFLNGNLFGKKGRDEAAAAAADHALLIQAREDLAKREREWAEERAKRERELAEERERHKQDAADADDLANDLRDQRDKWRVMAEVTAVRLGIENPGLPPMPPSPLAIVNDAPPRKRLGRR